MIKQNEIGYFMTVIQSAVPYFNGFELYYLNDVK